MSLSLCILLQNLTDILEENTTSVSSEQGLFCNVTKFYHSTVHGVRSSILHSHLKLHRNFLNWEKKSEKNVQSIMYFWSTSLSNSPTPLPSFVGYSNRMKLSVFFTYPYKMNPKYTCLLSHPLDQPPYILVATQPV
jgi:hypothetical protein